LLVLVKIPDKCTIEKFAHNLQKSLVILANQQNANEVLAEAKIKNINKVLDESKPLLAYIDDFTSIYDRPVPKIDQSRKLVHDQSRPKITTTSVVNIVKVLLTVFLRNYLNEVYSILQM